MEPQSVSTQTAGRVNAATLIGGTFVTLVLLAGTVYTFDRPFAEYVISFVTGRGGEPSAAWEPISLIESGDFAQAAQQAEAFLEKGGREGANVARSALDVGTFYTGSYENRIKAIQLTKEFIRSLEGDPYSQALQVNKLLSYIQIAADGRINREIFTGEPFKNFWVPEDLSSSIKNLAEYSLSLYPTTNARFHTAVWYVDRIRNIRGAWNATDAEKKLYANEILRIIDVADQSFAESERSIAGRPFDYTERFHLLFSKVYFYSAVSRVYPQYLKEVKESFVALEKEYEAVRARTGGVNAFAATRMPDAYVAYAGALQQVAGRSAYAEVSATLDKLVEFVESDPKPHEGVYLTFIRQDRSKLTKATRERAFSVYYDLAVAHPPFRAFLERNGWIFE